MEKYNMEVLVMEFQNRLNELRRKAGLSQENLAELLGVTRQAVQKWESGASRPDMDNLAALARYFNVSLDYLVTGQTPSESSAPVVIENHYYGWQREYKSQRTLFGLPLVHVCVGKGRWARGVLAIGDRAVGIIALGGLACGVFSLGGLSLGLIALGGLALGIFALGGAALGAIAWGGFALGYLALGGIAWGQYAVGGIVTGAKLAIGNIVSAPLAVGDEVGHALTFLPLDGSVSNEAIQLAVRQAAAGAPGFIREFLAFIAVHVHP